MNFHVSSRWLTALVIIVLIASVLLVGCTSTPKPAPTGSLTIAPTQATIGKAFGLTINGSGFKANERVSLWLVNARPNENLGLAFAPNVDIFAIADASGTFSVKTHANMQVPPQTVAGTYTMQAVGETSGTVATTTINIVK